MLIETAHAINRTAYLQFSRRRLIRMISLIIGFANTPYTHTHTHKMHDNTRKMLMQWLDISPYFDFKCSDPSLRLNITTILKGYCFHITHTSSSLFVEHHLETNCQRIWCLELPFTLNKSWASRLTSNASNHHCAVKLYNMNLWISRKSATVDKKKIQLNWIRLKDCVIWRKKDAYIIVRGAKKIWKNGSLWIMSPFEKFGTKKIFNNCMEYSVVGSTTRLEWAYIV